MNEIQIFQNQEFGAIRTISNEQGEVMFCGNDVALALGYTKPRNAIAQHVDEGDKTTALIQGGGLLFHGSSPCKSKKCSYFRKKQTIRNP